MNKCNVSPYAQSWLPKCDRLPLINLKHTLNSVSWTAQLSFLCLDAAHLQMIYLAKTKIAALLITAILDLIHINVFFSFNAKLSRMV